MSGIYIHGMEMPNKCMDCACSGTYIDELWVCEINAELLTSTELNDMKPEWCPIVPVPDHGRLIDADAIHYIVGGTTVSEMDYARKYHIDRMPTIIPADKEDCK